MIEPRSTRNPYQTAVNIHQTRLLDEYALLYPKISALHVNPQHLSDLLAIGDFAYRLANDVNFKLNILNHVKFCMTIKTVIRALLAEEATDAFLKDLREREGEMHLREVDALDNEQLVLARALILLAQKEKDLMLIALLQERIHLSTMIITYLYVEREKILLQIADRTKKFVKQLDEPLNKIDLYKDLKPKQQVVINEKIRKKLDKIEKRYNLLLDAYNQDPTREFTQEELGHLKGLIDPSGSRRVSKEYLEEMRRHSKHAAVHKIVNNFADENTKTRPPAIEIDAAAKGIIHLHEAYVNDIKDLNGKILNIDHQIKVEEEKREKCVQVMKEKLKKTDNPKKINELKEQIQTFHTKEFDKLSSMKSSLRAKIDEMRVVDEWLIHQHPEVFEAVFEKEREAIKSVEQRRQLYPGQTGETTTRVPLREYHLDALPTITQPEPKATPKHPILHSDWSERRLKAKKKTLDRLEKAAEPTAPTPEVTKQTPSLNEIQPPPGIRKHALLRQQGLPTKKQNSHSQTDPDKPKPKKKDKY